MVQLMPLPLTVSCFSKGQIGFTVLVPAHLGSPGKRAVKRACVGVCVQDHRGRWSEDKTPDLGHRWPGAFSSSDAQLLPWCGRCAHGLRHHQVLIPHVLLLLITVN